MKYLLVILFAFTFLNYSAKATKYGKLHKVGGIAGGYITFDSENNAWFGCETGIYKVPYGTDSLIKVEEFRDDSQVVKIDYNRVLHEGSPFICFAGENAILGLLDKIYLLKPNKIIRIDTLLKDLYDPYLYLCHITDDKTFWLNVKNGSTAFPGLYHLDPETLTFEHYPWATDGRGYPALGANIMHLHKHKDYYWYPGTSSELTFFNKDTAGIIGLEALMEDSVAFSFKKEGWFCGDTYYFNGYDNKIYKYNLDSGKLTVEDLTNTIVYKENQDLIHQDNTSRIALACVTEKFQVVKIYAEYAPRFINWYYKEPDDSLYHKIEVDTNLITSFSRVFIDRENILWASVGYDNEETNRHELGFIKFDPLAPGTSVEETESIPTLQTTRLYPNPTKRTATVRFFLNPNFRKEVKFDIYDYMGNKVKSLDSEYSYDASIAFGTKTIDVVGMHTGAYYLVIDNGNEKSSIGFIVE